MIIDHFPLDDDFVPLAFRGNDADARLLRIDEDLAARGSLVNVRRLALALGIHQTDVEPVKPVGGGMKSKRILVRVDHSGLLPGNSLVSGDEEDQLLDLVALAVRDLNRDL